MSTEAIQKETKAFDTEIKDLLHLIIHSLYSNKEIFIRELLSNASDALDKLRFLSLTHKELMGNDSELKIQVWVDEKNKTLHFKDNGIGMNKEDLISHLGTVARSGTKNFLNNMKDGDKKDVSLIGQFGVGFYSAFMVAKTVKVRSLKAGEAQAWVWESDGKGSYEIYEDAKRDRGTEIIIECNEEGEEFLNEWQVKSIIRKFSNYVTYDIQMPKPVDEKESPDVINLDKWEKINAGKPIWLKSKNDITDEMYDDFYKHVSHDFESPLKKLHFSQEGLTNFSALVYLPKKAPFDLWSNPEKLGISLYVKKVFIMDDCKELIPNYLRFIKGVVDTEDLPLNVSREILQQTKTVSVIKKTLVKKIIDFLADLAEKEGDSYMAFYREMGNCLKEGVYSDFENKDKLAKLLRFKSLKTLDSSTLISLTEYVSSMDVKQKDIYFVTAASDEEAAASPHLEVFQKHNLDVLFLTSPIDEWLVSVLTEFEGKKLVSVTKGDVSVFEESDEHKKELETKENNLKEVLDAFRSILQDQIKSVRLSRRLTDSPCCLVADQDAMTANMERILKMSNAQGFSEAKKILEINPDHPLINTMQEKLKSGVTRDEFKDWIELLYDQALLSQGSKIRDPRSYNNRFNQFLIKMLAK